MVTFRVPSRSPSPDPGAPPAPERAETDDPPNLQISRGAWVRPPPGAPPNPKEKGTWVLFVGNLDPRVVEKDLYGLFVPFLSEDGRGIKNIIICSTRGCCLPQAPQSEDDRCYATVEFEKFAPAGAAYEYYKKNPPILYELKIAVVVCRADLPDLEAILKRVLHAKTKAESRRSRKRTPARKRERQAGPSRTPHQKPRHNPLARGKPA